MLTLSLNVICDIIGYLRNTAVKSTKSMIGVWSI